MKSACIILTVVITVSIVAIICMVKFATMIRVDEKRKDQNPEGVHSFARNLGVINIKQNQSFAHSHRIPYTAAIMRNHTNNWIFSCFGSIILHKWIVSTAHCRVRGYVHRILLYYEYARNQSHTYSIIFWRIHEKFKMSDTSPMYDIAVAKFNTEGNPYTIQPATFDSSLSTVLEASMWKTVITMDKKMYLTNDFDIYVMDIVHPGKCYETYGVELADESLICVDMSKYDDCFVTEFGPVYNKDRIVGLLAVRPKECESKLAIFTNVSFYTTWILRNTQNIHFGK